MVDLSLRFYGIGDIPGRMTVKRMYFALLATAVVAGCALRLLDVGVAGFSSARGAGETIGRVGALFLLAVLGPTVLVLLYRKRMASAASPTAVGIVVLAAFSYSSYRAIQFEHSLVTLPPLASQIFNPPGCEFAVVFPSAPKTTSVVVPGFGEVPEAEISDVQGLMRASCISLTGDGSVQTMQYFQDRQLLLRTVQAFAEQNGLSNVSYFHDHIDLGVRARARGTKQIDGRWATYETVWFVSPRSVMSLTVGHLSESYPTEEISGFLDSVTRTDHSTKATSNESSFVMLRLPFEVAIDIPRNWWVLDDAINQLIRTSAEAVLDLRGITTSEDDETLLIAANSWPPVTYAALRVTRVQPRLAAPEEVLGLTKTELAELRAELETEMRQCCP
jgi:hypothetical protein